uniref:Uncharacterized protein n=1 Tax=Rhizophora mucronata TaxID=61149 RepID=A0A2P2M9Y5_RHIMU
MGEEEEREIEVRALNGESTKIWMPAGKCVKDLKQLLALTWPPAIAAAGTAASSTPNFHLFFKASAESTVAFSLTPPFIRCSFLVCANNRL